MAAPKSILAASGAWIGESTLNLPWLEDESKRLSTSDSRLDLKVGERGAFAMAHYTWSYDGQAQEGVLLMAGPKGAWVDSWHQSGEPMALNGTADAVDLKGEYGEGDDVWGWKVKLFLEGDALILEMVNVHPDGKEDWAVRANYHRLD